MRYVAVILPELRFELAEERERLTNANGPSQKEAAVVIRTQSAQTLRDLTGNTRIAEARDLPGVRPGDTLARARSEHAWTRVFLVQDAWVEERLQSLAESLLKFGATVGFCDEPVCTLWVEVQGSAHLFGGETQLLSEISKHIGPKHRHALAVAQGKTLAQMFARHADARGGQERWTIPEHKVCSLLANLSIDLLPIDDEEARYFARLGMHTCGDLMQLPRASLQGRIQNPQVLALLAGHDLAPLTPHVPEVLPEEAIELEWPVRESEALVFLLRPLAERLLQRMSGRGMGMAEAVLRLSGRPEAASPSALHMGAAVHETDEVTFQFSTPVVDGHELERVLRAKVLGLLLKWPVAKVALACTQVATRPPRANDLFDAHVVSRNALSRIVNELENELGRHRVGKLQVESAWRMQERSKLVPWQAGAHANKVLPKLLPVEPSRLKFEAGTEEDGSSGHVKVLRHLLRIAQPTWWRAANDSCDVMLGWNGEHVGVYERSPKSGELRQVGFLD
jgi:hypothetical protein